MKEVAFILVGIFFGVMFSLIFISTKQTSDDMKIKSYREYLRGYSEGLDYAVDVLSKDDSLQIKSSKKFGKIMVNKATKDVFLISGEDTFITSRFPDGNVGCGQKHTDHLYKTKKWKLKLWIAKFKSYIEFGTKKNMDDIQNMVRLKDERSKLNLTDILPI